MREKKKFGKRTDTQRKLPNDTIIKETFGIVNSGCDSKQVVNFIERTTCHKIDMEDNKQKLRYMKHVEELYAKGYRFIIKVTDPNNKAYLFADNPSGLYETKDCVDWYDEYDGINHYTYDQAKKEAACFQKNHPNWIVQIKEISFNKK